MRKPVTSRLRSSVGVAIALTALVASCKDEPKGMPPAKDWQPPAETAAPEVTAPPATATGTSPHGDTANPHGGMANPHGGMANPHGAMGDMGDMAGQPPAHAVGSAGGPPMISGTITVAADVAAEVGDRPVLFLSVHRADPASGEPTGPTLATDKIDGATFPASFELSGAMEGQVVVTAWSDADHDAISKQPGDVIGNVRVEVPAKSVELVLDKVVE